MSRKARISAEVVSLMAASAQHAWTLEELHSELAQRGQATDFSSVFRAAEKLAATGVLRKLLIEDGKARFEFADAHHDHLYCTSCHQLVPVPCLVGPEKFAAIEQATGVAIRDHHLVLSGLCRACVAAAA